MKEVIESPLTKEKCIKDYALVNGISMYYEIHGAGDTPLVLIHGGGSTIETTFGNILPLLAKHYKVLAVELDAHGRTSDRNGPSSFEQDADDVAALLNYLGINKANFLGFSNGGNTAMQIAIRHSNVVNRLVVASSLYKRDGLIQGFFDGLQQATLDNIPELLKTGYLQVAPDKDKLQVMFDKDKNRMLQFKDWPDEYLRSINAPTLLMLGDQDVVTPEHCVEMFRLLPNARLCILPGTHGAYIGEVTTGMQDNSVLNFTVSIIEQFLKECD